ncbi:kinase-like protein [Gigaspora margarita]|uniref:Kinase-like protein n=1 Tax=Gigaspora margarita TaxID=4874 RepID=A0A8H4B485_GIGMA|nr:kinase-like protein [Gigaspora margarita]
MYQITSDCKKLKEIPYDSLVIKKKLGRRDFGTVYQAHSSLLGYVVIKEIEEATMDENAQKLLINELKRLNESNHERIIKFYGISLDKKKKSCYLISEFANNGTLREYLQKNKVEWPEKIQLASQISKGMYYLHRIGIIHRNLHTSNILIHNRNVKISDFGISKNLDSIAATSSKKPYGVIPFIDPCKLEDPGYPYDKRSDVYSIGVLLWEISSNGQPPFDQNYVYDLPLRIIQGLRENPIEGTPERYINLYSNCWDYEPDKRPLTIQILQQLNYLDPKMIALMRALF